MFKNKPDSFRKNLSEINQLVHACESIISGTKKIRIVWFDLPKVNKFTKSDYDLFTNQIKFGYLYYLYCDVGKNIESLCRDNDDHHHDFVPNIHYSADCVCFFKQNSKREVEKLELDYKNKIEKNKQKLLKSGYHVKDKNLTTGRIPLAKLDMAISQDKLLKRLKNYNNIQSFLLI
mgnify:FL=1